MKSVDRFLGYFERSVLSKYRASPDLYMLDEDDMGGTLETIHGENELPQERPYFRVRFGFRKLSNRFVCIAAWGPDVEHLPEREKNVWVGYLLENSIFHDNDPAFNRWVDRNVNGSWAVESGPKSRLGASLSDVQVLTRHTLSVPLFKFTENPLLNYPEAENSESYAKAHLELYRLIVDGLNLSSIRALARKLGVILTSPEKSLNSIKEILPAELIPIIHKTFKRCSTERNKNHGLPNAPIKSFPAFDEFHRDLTEMAIALSSLKTWLEEVLGVSAEKCNKRERELEMFPKLVGSVPANSTLHTILRAEGKTIQKIDYGPVESSPEVHQSEAIIIHFTDGTSLSIKIGSNAYNLSDEKIQPNDFHTALIVYWTREILTKQD